MWEFLVERFRFTLLIILMIVLMGGFALLSLPREASPEVKVPFASVTTIYPGASPVDIEKLITEPIEENLSGITDLKSMSSGSSESMSNIFLEFETDADIKDRVRAVEDAVSQVERSLPDGAEDPIVAELNFNNQPILILSLSSDLPHSELVLQAELLESKISEINGISSVELLGVRDKVINVSLDPASLTQFGISVTEVMMAIQSAESNLPIGSIESNDVSTNLRFSSELELESLNTLIVRQNGNASIYLRDLAEIRFELEEETQLSRTSFQAGKPQNAISINVYKGSGGDIIEMVNQIDEIIATLQEDELSGTTVFASLDSAQDIRDQLRDLSLSGLQTIILVGLILFFVLGFREALVAGFSIPLTFLITFFGLSVTGATLNFLSLFSLILALGILVDTGIVITEGMHSRLDAGKSRRAVALETVREYQWPLISGTMTTVAAFLPMLFMTGIIGEFIKHIPRTVVMTLLASLFVGLGILPSIGSRLLQAREKKVSWSERKLNGVRETYRNLLDWILAYKRRQTALIGFMIFMFFVSMSLPALGILNMTMFPPADYYLFFIEIELPKGSQLSETEAVVKEIELELLQETDIESFVSTVGSAGTLSSGDLGTTTITNSHLANFTINLKDDRERSALDIVADYQERFIAIKGADVEVIGVSDGPPTAAAIEFKIYGDDLDLLKVYSDEAVALLESIEGTNNVNSSLNEKSYEFVMRVDHQKVQAAGLNASTLAQIARISVSGINAATISVDGKDTDLILKTSSDTDIQDVLALPIISPTNTFPLSYFVELSYEAAPSTIARSDGDRSVNISSDLDSGVIATTILPEFQEKFDPDFADGYRIEFGGEAEEMAESFASLGRAMIAGMFLILIILVIQFNSFKQSLIILFTIPLALIGVFFGLSAVMLPLSFPAFIGIVALAGIVVNNAIILIDRINKNILEGMTKEEAISSAGASRFQPILLTSITTVAGILPLALSDPGWGPLGFSIIFGLLFSTLLTLLVIPACYQRFIKHQELSEIQDQ